MATITTIGSGSFVGDSRNDINTNFSNLNTDKLENVSEDTTPALGGNLDVSGNAIVSTSAGNIPITPDTTGKIILDGLSWPTADGTANQVIGTDGAGNLFFTTPSSSSNNTTTTGTAFGSNFAIGDVGQITSNGIEKADASAESTANGTLVMSTAAVLDGSSGSFMILGNVVGLSGLSSGLDYYVSETAGEIVTSAPVANGTVVRVIGRAVSATEFQFNGTGAYTVNSVIDVPDQVTGLVATSAVSSVSLSWNEPANNGSPISDYFVEYKLTSEPTTWTTFSHTALEETAISVTGLTNNSSYDFRVSGVNAVGTGTASATATATPVPANDVEQVITTGMELFLDAKSYSGTGNWENQIASPSSEAVENDYDVTPTDVLLWTDSNKWVMDNSGYFDFASNSTFLNALHKTQAGNAWTFFAKFRTPEFSAQLDTMFSTGDTAGDYGIRIRSDSGGNLKLDHYDGTTVNTDTIATGIVADTDYVIAIAYDYDTDTHSVAVNADTFTTDATLAWTDAVSTNATYAANIATNGGVGNTMENDAYIYAIGFVDKVISNTELADLRGFLDAYFVPAAATAPNQVTGLSAVSGDTLVNLSWSVPSNGGASITDYLVEYKETSSGTWLTFSDGVSTTPSAAVNSLTNDTAYDFRVSAINAVGTGTASATSSATPTAAGGGGSGDPYDESPYKLTLPVNSAGVLSYTNDAEEILQPALLTYSDQWFQRPNDGTFVFVCPAGGARTATATYARCEFRHLEDIAWTTPTEDTVDVSITSCPLDKKTVIHQIHGNDQPPWFKTQYIEKGAGSGRIYVLVKNLSGSPVLNGDGSTTANDADFPAVDLKTNMTLGDRTVLRSVYTGSALQFYVDGVLVHTQVTNYDPVYAGTTYYWKRGNYFQSDDRDGTTCTVIHYTNANNYIGNT